MPRIVLLLISLMSLIGAVNAAQTPFYAGKTIRLVSGTSEGGGGDLYWRLIQQYLGRFIPGHPTVIKTTMQAGGGMAQANYIYAAARRDGTEVGLFNRNVIFSPLLSNPLAKFDSAKFQWIGTPSSYANNAWVFLVRRDGPIRSIDDLIRAKKPPHIGGTGTANPFIGIMRDVLGIKMDFIPSYSEPQLVLALERGEIDGFGLGYQTILTSMPDLIKKKKIKIILQFGHKDALPALATVPTGVSLAKSQSDTTLIEFASSWLTLGFPIGLPPDAPKVSVKILRDAFRHMMESKEVKQEMAKRKLDYSPKFGTELQSQIDRLGLSSSATVDRYKKILAHSAR